MKYSTILLFLASAVGCNDAKPAKVADAAPAGPQWPTTGKPLPDEAAASIKDFFSDLGIGYTNVKVERVSDPVEAPKPVADPLGGAWVCSVTMSCNNAIGDKLQNKNWLVLMDRENGHATVKDYFSSLEAVEHSSLGKEWFAQKGFPKPEGIMNNE